MEKLAQNNNDCKKELEEMTDSYYNYLVNALAVIDLHPSDSDKIYMLNLEIAKANNLLNTGETISVGLMSSSSEHWLFPKPTLGIRRLPEFFIKGHQIYDVHYFVLAKKELKYWEENGYEIIMGIAIAQCKALRLYKQTLEEKLAELNHSHTSKVNLASLSDILFEGDLTNDKRIPFDKSKREDLYKDFMKLTDLGILSEEDVIYWLCKEFQGFQSVQGNRILKPKSDQGIILYFVKQVYEKYDQNRKRIALYRNMLNKRISLFGKHTPEYLRAHFADKKPQKFPDGLMLK